MTIDELRAQLKRSPDDVACWYALASALNRAGRHDEEAQAWERAASLSPADHLASTVYNWGNALLSSGDPTGAIERYRDAIARGRTGGASSRNGG